MYRKVWEHCKPSVCSIDFISNAGTKIISFTGFKVKNFLITDDIVDKFAKPAEILIRFAESEDWAGCIRMSFKEFLNAKIKIEKKINPGFVLFDIKEESFKSIPSLNCSKRINHSVGHPIAVLGYQLDQDNLAIKSGIISSYFTQSDGLNTIQVDCSIQQGNAGSPLICAETMEVIGVIGHRLASIARGYQKMMRIINTNLKVLQEAEGKINMEDIDPIQVLIANQNQIKHMVSELFKTTNMRVGFAAELCNMTDYCPDPEEDLGSIETEINVDN
ncbi:serine protease [Bacteroidota bacterium]